MYLHNLTHIIAITWLIPHFCWLRSPFRAYSSQGDHEPECFEAMQALSLRLMSQNSLKGGQKCWKSSVRWNCLKRYHKLQVWRPNFCKALLPSLGNLVGLLLLETNIFDIPRLLSSSHLIQPSPSEKKTFKKNMTGWWFGVLNIFYFSIQLGMSSSQLTFTPSFFRGVGWNHQPDKKPPCLSTWTQPSKHIQTPL